MEFPDTTSAPPQFTSFPSLVNQKYEPFADSDNLYNSCKNS